MGIFLEKYLFMLFVAYYDIQLRPQPQRGIQLQKSFPVAKMGGYWFHFFCIMYSLYQSIKVSFYFLTYQSIKVSFSFLSSEDYYVFLSAGCFRVLGIFSIKVQDLSFLLSSKLSILGIVFIDSCLVQRNTFVSMDFSLLLCCREERYLS